jgi:hypothetical protein
MGGKAASPVFVWSMLMPSTWPVKPMILASTFRQSFSFDILHIVSNLWINRYEKETICISLDFSSLKRAHFSPRHDHRALAGIINKKRTSQRQYKKRFFLPAN